MTSASQAPWLQGSASCRGPRYAQYAPREAREASFNLPPSWYRMEACLALVQFLIVHICSIQSFDSFCPVALGLRVDINEPKYRVLPSKLVIATFLFLRSYVRKCTVRFSLIWPCYCTTCLPTCSRACPTNRFSPMRKTVTLSLTLMKCQSFIWPEFS